MTPEQWARKIVDGLDAARRASSITCPVNEMGLIEAAIADATSVNAKLLSYLQQENEVLIERIRLLEISLSSEREACAKVADAYGYKADQSGAHTDMEASYVNGKVAAAENIASLIRGRGEK